MKEINNLQNAGGIASLLMASVYLVGFVEFYLFLTTEGSPSPLEKVEILIASARPETGFFDPGDDNVAFHRWAVHSRTEIEG